MSHIEMSHIEIQHGDLLQAPAQALVNTVNCVGVMGKGIALQFERTFPTNTRAYKEACKAGTLHPGELLIVQIQPELGRELPHYIVNFATKAHWRGRSRLEWIESGLQNLVAEVERLGITSIAVPPLGCGNGGLDWNEVKPLIYRAFEPVPATRVLLWPPEGAPDATQMAASAKPPTLTPIAALYIRLLARYSVIDLEFSQLELQKLAYLLQEAGEPLRLQFKAMTFGPAARELGPMLRNWEHHWTIGFGDGSGGIHRPMVLKPEIIEAAEAYLRQHPAPESEKRVQDVLALIEGLDTALGLELLATVHWVARQHPLAAHDWQEAARHVRAWNTHKQATFTPDWVRIAWQQLQHHGWLENGHPIS